MSVDTGPLERSRMVSICRQNESGPGLRQNAWRAPGDARMVIHLNDQRMVFVILPASNKNDL